VVGVRPGATCEAVKAGAEARRATLRQTPMPQDRRREELTWCDHAERVLCDAGLRRDWERARTTTAAPAVVQHLSRTEAKNKAERDARLAQAAADRPPYLDAYLSTRASAPGFLAVPAQEEALAAAAREAARVTDQAGCIDRALALRQGGQPAPALAWARRAAAIRPSAHALNVLGTVEREAGDLAASERSLRASLAREPNPLRNAPGHVALAATLRAEGRAAEALDLADRVLESDPEDRYAHRTRAGALADLGRADEAVRALDASQPLDPQGALELVRQLRAQRVAAGDRRGVAVAEDALRHLEEGR
jgi:tetratricopeptide (TPR) repeat protein